MEEHAGSCITYLSECAQGPFDVTIIELLCSLLCQPNMEELQAPVEEMPRYYGRPRESGILRGKTDQILAEFRLAPVQGDCLLSQGAGRVTRAKICRYKACERLEQWSCGQ